LFGLPAGDAGKVIQISLAAKLSLPRVAIFAEKTKVKTGGTRAVGVSFGGKDGRDGAVGKQGRSRRSEN
jgi:hypothetical protein